VPADFGQGLTDHHRATRGRNRGPEHIFRCTRGLVEFADLFEERIDRQRVVCPAGIQADRYASILDGHVCGQCPTACVCDAQVAVAQNRFAVGTDEYKTTLRPASRRERAC
jgi:hypothetical protein